MNSAKPGADTHRLRRAGRAAAQARPAAGEYRPVGLVRPPKSPRARAVRPNSRRQSATQPRSGRHVRLRTICSSFKRCSCVSSKPCWHRKRSLSLGHPMPPDRVRVLPLCKQPPVQVSRRFHCTPFSTNGKLCDSHTAAITYKVSSSRIK